MFREAERGLVFNTADDRAYWHHADLVVWSLEEARQAAEQGAQRIVLNADDRTRLVQRAGGAALEYWELEPTLEWCYRTGGWTVILEEAHDLCSRTAAGYWLLRCARRGRHRGMKLVWVSQRCQTVHTALTSNTSCYAFFRGINEPADLEHIRERCGEDVIECIGRAGVHEPVWWP